MRFQIASDLHLEYLPEDNINILDYITPSCEILILAGDISSIYRYKQLYNFLKSATEVFQHVIFVPGNHEYYTQPGIYAVKIHELRKKLYSIRFENLYILDRNSIIIEDILVAGCTFWSSLKKEDSDELNFFPKFRVKIHNLSPKTYNFYHERDIDFVESMKIKAKSNDLQLVIVSHYAPSKQLAKNIKRNVS